MVCGFENQGSHDVNAAQGVWPYRVPVLGTDELSILEGKDMWGLSFFPVLMSAIC